MVKKDKTTDFAKAQQKYPHLKRFVDKTTKELGKPSWHAELPKDADEPEKINLIYPVGDPIFIHIKKTPDDTKTYYNVVEPKFTEEEQKIYDEVIDKLVDLAYKEPVPDDITKTTPILKKLLREATTVGVQSGGTIQKLINPKVQLTQKQFEKIEYFLLRNRVGYGKLEPLFYDPHLEDIHCTGVGRVTTIHKVFDMVYTNIIFDDDYSVDKYIEDVTERVERPASDANAVVDAIMPDGSRSNFIYGKDISLEGSSFTVRKFAEEPISITQIIKWKTMDVTLAAYLWLALEHGMNLFVCGETASGKTTTLNAISAFIKPDDKVYTVENTPEVTMPHPVWQHLVTRESGKDSDVTYLDLLVAALRSRPDYIIVGEIRAEEGNIAFQAMQTGHPVMSTFHAGNVTTMIQRITGEPINVPITFVDNLNICLIQQAVYRGSKFVRRVLSLTELERYFAPDNKIITREVFTWNSTADQHVFRGMFNSYILEQKIAKTLGYTDPKRIYNEMDLRAKILKRMIEEDILDYFEVWEVLKKFHAGGVKALPFKL